jgi:hypothetical protein
MTQISKKNGRFNSILIQIIKLLLFIVLFFIGLQLLFLIIIYTESKINRISFKGYQGQIFGIDYFLGYCFYLLCVLIFLLRTKSKEKTVKIFRMIIISIVIVSIAALIFQDNFFSEIFWEIMLYKLWGNILS